MLGLFDSGLGGLTVVRRVRELLPLHDLLFFADQAHVPYGDRTPGDLLTLLKSNVARLDERGVDAIVMACNTSCAIAARYGWPRTDALVIDLIESAALAVETSGFQRIGVIATNATARSGAYRQKICEHVPGAEVFEVGAPALVPLVEAGKLEGSETRAAVKDVCAALPRDLDAVLLACTHYPMLDAHFAAALGSVVRIDPALVHAQRAAALALEHGFAAGSGATRCETNADPQVFHANVDKFLSAPAGSEAHR